MDTNKIPSYDNLMNPLLKALHSLGGSGSIEEIYDRVVEQEQMSDAILSAVHDPDKSTQTEIAYRLAWARTYLKKYGLLENSTRGIWALASSSSGIEEINPKVVVAAVRAQDRKDSEDGSIKKNSGPASISEDEEVGAEEEWKQKLHRLLTQSLTPEAFERLVQRLLRESGFTQVEVTGRTGDGGIDGKGIARIHGLMSFHVLFQCKRYKGSVGSGEIRDFRGAMVGRSDKGLFITTGTFTPAAVKEATRDGAPAIDLIDGAYLAEKLKELRLGVTTSVVEVVLVEDNWFETV
jgi:restriction system protein